MTYQQLHPLEPLSIGMMLDKALRLYIQNFALMFGIAAILLVPMHALAVVNRFIPWKELSIYLGPAGTYLAAITTIVLFALGWIIVWPLVTGAATKAISELYLGQKVSIGSAFRASWNKCFRLFLTMLVVSLYIFLGLILLVIPGIRWALSYSLIVPVIILEPSNSERSWWRNLKRNMERSRELVDGNRGKVFKVLFVYFALSNVLAIGSGFLVHFAMGSYEVALTEVTGNVLAAFIEILLYPLQFTLITLLYYDFRIRKEGFDLEMLSQALRS